MIRIVKVTEGMRSFEKGFIVDGGPAARTTNSRGAGIVFCADSVLALDSYFRFKLKTENRNFKVRSENVDVLVVSGEYFGKSKASDALNYLHQRRVMQENFGAPIQNEKAGKIGLRGHRLPTARYIAKGWDAAQTVTSVGAAMEKTVNFMRGAKYFFGFVQPRANGTPHRIFIEQSKIVTVRTVKSGSAEAGSGVAPDKEWLSLLYGATDSNLIRKLIFEEK